ncbi:MAG: Smr/MutS family protein [Dehalococcoidia bacterium]
MEPPSVEVHLRRMTVEEAMIKLDRYLNAAFLAGLPQVRIVHGKGTGALRKAVMEVIGDHPLVGSYRGATLEEGGGGVTIAELALS